LPQPEIVVAFPGKVAQPDCIGHQPVLCFSRVAGSDKTRILQLKELMNMVKSKNLKD
jgi:hypothetical protein